MEFFYLMWLVLEKPLLRLNYYSRSGAEFWWFVRRRWKPTGKRACMTLGFRQGLSLWGNLIISFDSALIGLIMSSLMRLTVSEMKIPVHTLICLISAGERRSFSSLLLRWITPSMIFLPSSNSFRRLKIRQFQVFQTLKNISRLLENDLMELTALILNTKSESKRSPERFENVFWNMLWYAEQEKMFWLILKRTCSARTLVFQKCKRQERSFIALRVNWNKPLTPPSTCCNRSATPATFHCCIIQAASNYPNLKSSNSEMWVASWKAFW